jgi:hypothetical protein
MADRQSWSLGGSGSKAPTVSRQLGPHGIEVPSDAWFLETKPTRFHRFQDTSRPSDHCARGGLSNLKTWFQVNKLTMSTRRSRSIRCHGALEPRSLDIKVLMTAWCPRRIDAKIKQEHWFRATKAYWPIDDMNPMSRCGQATKFARYQATKSTRQYGSLGRYTPKLT